jgi:hypothetical protein
MTFLWIYIPSDHSSYQKCPFFVCILLKIMKLLIYCDSLMNIHFHWSAFYYVLPLYYIVIALCIRWMPSSETEVDIIPDKLWICVKQLLNKKISGEHRLLLHFKASYGLLPTRVEMGNTGWKNFIFKITLMFECSRD